MASHLLLSLEVVEENRALLRLLTPVLDDNARAVDNLTGVTLTVELACKQLAPSSLSTRIPKRDPLPIKVFFFFFFLRKRERERKKHTKPNPLPQHLPIGDLNQGNLVLRAKRNNQLLVGLLLAALVQDTHVRLATVQRLSRLTQAARKTVVDQRDAEHALERVQDGHLARRVAGVGRHLDLVGRNGRVGLGLFSVRLLIVRVWLVLVFLICVSLCGRWPLGGCWKAYHFQLLGSGLFNKCRIFLKESRDGAYLFF